MAPGITTDGTMMTLIPSKDDETAALYYGFNEAELQLKAQKFLLNYGTKLMRMSSTAAKRTLIISSLKMGSPPVIRFGECLFNLLPPGLDKAFYLSTAGESNEPAIKMAKVHIGKFEIVGLSTS
ncbi:hypothetical protein N7523_009123 [Penicillium sp. IBT 18751x]|nr:hypothetical protein N7523_009123 [Penicillium sp. IBT 18751x]